MAKPFPLTLRRLTFCPAIAAFEQALLLKPDYAEAKMKLNLVRQQRGRRPPR